MYGTKRIENFNNKCFLQDVPFRDGDVTNIEITHKKFDVNMINKGFLTVDMKVKFQFDDDYEFQVIQYKDGTLYENALDEYTYEDYRKNKDLPAYYDDVTFTDEAPIFFLGWKNAAESIQQMEVFNRKQPTRYRQIWQDRDAYLESMKYTTKTEKENMRYCYTTYDNVAHQDPCVAGCYIDSMEYEKNLIRENTRTFHFEHHLEYPFTVTPLTDKGLTALKQITGQAAMVLNSEYQIADDMFREILEYKDSSHMLKSWGETDVYINFDIKKDTDPNDSTDKYYSIDMNTGNKVFSDSQIIVYSTYLLFPDTTILEFDNPGPYDMKFIYDRAYGMKANTDYEKDIHLILPIKQFTAFKNFTGFDKAFGDITLQMIFGTRSMVWSLVGYTEKKHQSSAPGAKPVTYDDKGLHALCLKNIYTGFHQTRTPIEYVVGEPGYANRRDIKTTLSVSQLIITKLEADVFGYCTTDEERRIVNSIRAQNPLIYNTHQTDFLTFNTAIENGTLNAEILQPLRLVRDIHMTFPWRSNELNTFKNPCLKDLNLLIENVVYPYNVPWCTDEVRFIQSQLGNFDADDDYIKSFYHIPLINHEIQDEFYDKNIDPKEACDNTNFIVTWNVGYSDFDGFDNGSTGVNIKVRAGIYLDLPVGKIPYGEPNKQYPAPQIWFTTDTFWTADVDNGLVYHMYVKP